MIKSDWGLPHNANDRCLAQRLTCALTNLDESVFIKKVMDQGANGYFVKAKISPQELVEKIDTALRTQHPQ